MHTHDPSSTLAGIKSWNARPPWWIRLCLLHRGRAEWVSSSFGCSLHISVKSGVLQPCREQGSACTAWVDYGFGRGGPPWGLRRPPSYPALPKTARKVHPVKVDDLAGRVQFILTTFFGLCRTHPAAFPVFSSGSLAGGDQLTSLLLASHEWPRHMASARRHTTTKLIVNSVQTDREAGCTTVTGRYKPSTLISLLNF